MSHKSFELVLIEDSAADTFLIERALHGAGVKYTLHAFEDGLSALAFVNAYTGESRPDAFLVDLNIPKADGKQILKALKESETLSDVPAVVITSSPSPSDRTEIEQMGGMFITKPGNLTEFMRIGHTLKAVLERNQPSAYQLA